MSANIELSLTADRGVIKQNEPSETIVEVRLKAGRATSGTDRAPLNVGIAIDRSGSMSGDKIEYAKTAACYLVDALDERDRVAVVAYDDRIETVIPSTPVSTAYASDIKQSIGSLYSRGDTDLTAGWLTAANQVATNPLAGAVDRVILLSDGMANQGITDPNAIGVHADQLRKRGINTTTMGIGLDFNEHLLGAMAERGGGHFFYISEPRQIPDFFAREFGEMSQVVARGVTLNILRPEGTSVSLLGGLPIDDRTDRLSVPIGTLIGAEDRTLYLKVLTGAAGGAKSVTLDAELMWRGDDDREERIAAKLELHYADRAAVEAVEPSRDIRRSAADVDLAAGMQLALAKERAGDRSGARVLMDALLSRHDGVASEAMHSEGAGLAFEIAENRLTESDRKASYSRVHNVRHQR